MGRTSFHDRRRTNAMPLHDRRVEVAHAAWRVIIRDGLKRASMREIAKEMSCTTGVLAHYFQDKDALLRFTLEEVIGAVARQSADHPQAGKSRDAYVAYLVSLLPIDREGRDYWRAWVDFVGTAVHHADMRHLHALAYRHLRQEARAHLTCLQDNRELADTVDIAELADTIICFIDGIGLHATLSATDWPADRQQAFLKHFVSRNLPKP